MNYTIKRLEKGKFEDLQKIYTDVYGKSPSIDELSALYDTEVFGAFTIGYLAYDESGNPAAYYGVFPIKMYINNQVVLGAQSGATMTSPSHQKKGLFVRLAEQTYKTAFEEDIKIIFGFPNENSYPAFIKKLKWNFQGNMKTFEFRTSKIPLCELASTGKLVDRFYQILVNHKIKKLAINSSSLASINFSTHERSVICDSSYLSYKYRKPVARVIEINNFKIFISVSTHLYIGDVERFSMDRLEDFMRTVNELGSSFYCRRTIITLSESHWLCKLLSVKMEAKDSLPIGYIMPDDKVLERPLVFSVADYDTF